MDFLRNFDRAIFAFFNDWAGNNDFLDWFFSFSAEYLIFIVLFVVLVFLIKFQTEEKWLVINACTAALIGRFLLIPFIRLIFFRTRPFVYGDIVQLVSHNPAEASFPSGHTAVMFAVSCAVYLYHKKLGVLFFLISLWSGISRIVVGVHFPFDIFGGIVTGVISFWIAKKTVGLLHATMEKP